MIRAIFTAMLSVGLVCSTGFAQDAATRKANRAIHAQEKEILQRVTTRIEYDKKLEGATVKVEVQPGGEVVLSGSVVNEAAKTWAVELVENTTGVTSVTDRLAVVKPVKVQATKSATPPIEVTVPAESRIIVKP